MARDLKGSIPRYLVTGVGTSTLDFLLYTALAVVFDWYAALANICSTIVTICVSYIVNRRWVFESDRRGFASFLSFASVSLVTGLLLQTGIIWGLAEVADVLVPSASAALVKPAIKIIAMGVGASCNFLGYRYIFAGDDRR